MYTLYTMRMTLSILLYKCKSIPCVNATFFEGFAPLDDYLDDIYDKIVKNILVPPGKAVIKSAVINWVRSLDPVRRFTNKRNPFRPDISYLLIINKSP